MKKLLQLLAFVAGLGLAMQSCQKDEQFSEGKSTTVSENERRAVQTFYGPAREIGSGVARAWMSQDRNGNPIAIGVNLSEDALANLPTEETTLMLQLPRQRATDFYKFVMMNWNPNGHDPMVIYGLPHFDFHFYTVPQSQVMMYGQNDSAQIIAAPASNYVPVAYVQGPGVPMMGSHWVDVLSPEFNGSVFDKTFIYGSYDGEFVFYEPMITRDYLLSHPNTTTAIRQPSAFQHDGWYPQEYTVSYSQSPNQYTISLNLAFRSGQ